MKTDQEYIQHSSSCPRCGSSDLEGGAFDIGSGSCGQTVDCSACGLSWFDEYRLIGYTVQSAPPAPDPQDAQEPTMEQQLSRHLSEEEEAERRHLTDAGGKP